ncbi:MAG: class A beta-lactamase-related serine hydrolase, partial [Armatimonadetes bacterium]|nr:class A beta-lactamase-related serine hydrolase [Armatimonadota bacterium]
SVVKLFYMAYAHQLIAEDRLKTSEELDRAMSDMIRDSNNDATGLILDTITNTTGGPELGKAALKTWMEKRQSVNRWLATVGITGVNCCQKTWNEGPYGRERQGYGPNFELRNSLTADACATMLLKIITDTIVTPQMCEKMRTLLKRDPKSQTDTQALNFTGSLLAVGDQLFSKAGWTSTVRHDVANIKRGDREIIFAIFTKHRPSDPKFLQFLS